MFCWGGGEIKLKHLKDDFVVIKGLYGQFAYVNNKEE